MPPKHCAAKRARKNAKLSAANIPIDTGKCLFPSLPPSVVLHIISYTPVDINEPLDRIELLFALSRTCHNVRAITFPMAWELFDVTRTRRIGGQLASYCLHCGGSQDFADWTKYLPNDLLLELMHIHPLVRSGHFTHESLEISKAPFRNVRVRLTRRRTPEVLGAFAKCLEKLTSVTKLEITHAHTSMTTHLKNAFEGYTFPSIRTVILKLTTFCAPVRASGLSL